MLFDDVRGNNQIVDYDITFDNKSKKKVLEILEDCFSRRKIGLPIDEAFLLHKKFNLFDLKCTLESRSNKSKGGFQDLLVYYYTYDKPVPKQSIIGDIYLGEEINVSRTTITCSFSSSIAFILHHLNDEERSSFLLRHSLIEKLYLEILLDLGGYERLSNLLGSVESIEAFLKKCQHFDESMQLEDICLLEKIQYFKLIYSYATLTASRSYDRAYLNSIIPIDEMECEEIKDIQETSSDNTTIMKMLKLEPKCVIYNGKTY